MPPAPTRVLAGLIALSASAVLNAAGIVWNPSVDASYRVARVNVQNFANSCPNVFNEGFLLAPPTVASSSTCAGADGSASATFTGLSSLGGTLSGAIAGDVGTSSNAVALAAYAIAIFDVTDPAGVTVDVTGNWTFDLAGGSGPGTNFTSSLRRIVDGCADSVFTRSQSPCSVPILELVYSPNGRPTRESGQDSRRLSLSPGTYQLAALMDEYSFARSSGTFSVSLFVVPVPAAGLVFASALAGLGCLARRRRVPAGADDEARTAIRPGA